MMGSVSIEILGNTRFVVFRRHIKRIAHSPRSAAPALPTAPATISLMTVARGSGAAPIY
jgi:hypothetical protein